MKLVVTHAFGQYEPGNVITDPKEIAAVLESHAASVVKVAADKAATEAPAAGKRG
ncbi:hypothetical protein J7E70_02235 [Variovorax paradoxus]|nr:hypothetical protein [Variovorax paradoxus]MBT2299272.1 hypothetical protein [Variovorax paradoxus]